MEHTPSERRLNKFLALQLGVSRREADSLIEQRRITVNDTIASLGTRLQPADIIALDGSISKIRPNTNTFFFISQSAMSVRGVSKATRRQSIHYYPSHYIISSQSDASTKIHPVSFFLLTMVTFLTA